MLGERATLLLLCAPLLARGFSASPKLSPAEIFRQQQMEAQRDMREQKAQRRYEGDLRSLIDGSCPQHLFDRSFWMQYARGSLTIQEDCRAATVAAVQGGRPFDTREPQAEPSRAYLARRGFSRVEGVDLSSRAVDWDGISETMAALQAAGLPPVFVFMFDDVWRMCEGLHDVMSEVLGADCELEPSVYGWALKKPDSGAAAEERVGGNFGMPHRDLAYNACHLEDGTASIVSVWVPVAEATLENGCMYVVPREDDPLFTRYEERNHIECHNRFPFQYVLPLPATAGTVLMWNPNTIHFGSACSPDATHPRRSIAMSFRLPQHRQPFTQREVEQNGRMPFSRAELSAGVPIPERLATCARAILMYSCWHAEYKGFDLDALVTDRRGMQ